MSMSANALAWNPREPFNFAVASEDHNVYTFDMRRLNHSLMVSCCFMHCRSLLSCPSCLQVHKDHVGAVMDVSFAPTGKEFVTGSYDRTVRIWASDAGRSREIYHTKRMQRVFTVQVSMCKSHVRPSPRFLILCSTLGMRNTSFRARMTLTSEYGRHTLLLH
jgi:WD repeat and SOF domain-containing protein 1